MAITLVNFLHADSVVSGSQERQGGGLRDLDRAWRQPPTQVLWKDSEFCFTHLLYF